MRHQVLVSLKLGLLAAAINRLNQLELGRTVGGCSHSAAVVRNDFPIDILDGCNLCTRHAFTSQRHACTPLTVRWPSINFYRIRRLENFFLITITIIVNACNSILH